MGKVIVKSSKPSDIEIPLSSDNVIKSFELVSSSIHNFQIKMDLNMDYPNAIANSTSFHHVLTDSVLTEDIESYVSTSQGMVDTSLIYDNNALLIEYDYTNTYQEIEYLNSNNQLYLSIRINDRIIDSQNISIVDPTGSVSISYDGDTILDLYSNSVNLMNIFSYTLDNNDTVSIFPTNGTYDKGISNDVIEYDNVIEYPYISSGTYGYSPNTSLLNNIELGINSLKCEISKPSYPLLPSYIVDLNNSISTIMCRCDTYPNITPISISTSQIISQDIYIPILHNYVSTDTEPTGTLEINNIIVSLVITWDNSIGGRMNYTYDTTDFSALNIGTFEGLLTISYLGSSFTWVGDWVVNA